MDGGHNYVIFHLYHQQHWSALYCHNETLVQYQDNSITIQQVYLDYTCLGTIQSADDP